MRISGYEKNSEWDLVGSGVTSGEEVYAVGEEGELMTLATIGFEIELKRKPTFFVLNIVVPR